MPGRRGARSGRGWDALPPKPAREEEPLDELRPVDPERGNVPGGRRRSSSSRRSSARRPASDVADFDLAESDPAESGRAECGLAESGLAGDDWAGPPPTDDDQWAGVDAVPAGKHREGAEQSGDLAGLRAALLDLRSGGDLAAVRERLARADKSSGNASPDDHLSEAGEQRGSRSVGGRGSARQSEGAGRGSDPGSRRSRGSAFGERNPGDAIGSRFGGGSGRGSGFGDERVSGDEGEPERAYGRRGRGGGRRQAGGRESDGTRGRKPRDEGPPQTEGEVAREICLRQLAVRPRTRVELAKALAKREISDEVIAEVLDRYDEVGMIDDAAFARAWVSTRHQGRGLARRALANELRQRGVDAEVAGAALESVDDEAEAATARALVDRKLRTVRGEPDAVFRKLVGMLARKGYSAGVAIRAVKDALADRDAEAAEFAAQIDADAMPDE